MIPTCLNHRQMKLKEKRTTKWERRLNIFGSIFLIIMMYIILYIPKIENKSFIPLVCVIAGMMLQEYL